MTAPEVPDFLTVTSMPPHFDRHHFKTFCSVLLAGREANYQKEMHTLKAKLLRGGTANMEYTSTNEASMGRALSRLPRCVASGGLSDCFRPGGRLALLQVARGGGGGGPGRGGEGLGTGPVKSHCERNSVRAMR